MDSPIAGKFFDTMIVASSDNEWLQLPIDILVLETVVNHFKWDVRMSKLVSRRSLIPKEKRDTGKEVSVFHPLLFVRLFVSP